MRKELSEYEQGSILHFELYNEKPGNQHEYRQHGRSINASLVTGREVFKSAILSNASYVILLHNNIRTGDPQPSHHGFLWLHQNCVRCGNILGIDVLDHIIVGGRTWKVSFHGQRRANWKNLRTKLLGIRQ